MFCPLHLAALDGNVKHAQALMEKGEDPNVADVTGMRPLHKAARHGHQHLCSLLVQSSASVNCQDDQGRTALYLAASQGHAGCISVLIDEDADCTISTQKGETPLLAAIRGQKLTCAEALIRHGTPESLDMVSVTGVTALHLAARLHQHHALALLLQHGADSNKLDTVHGLSALHMAVEAGQEECTEVLLSHGADVNIASAAQGEAPLHLAAAKGLMGVLAKLLECSEVIVDTKDGSGQTPLVLAAVAGHLPVVAELLRNTASTTSQDNSEMTALMKSIEAKQDEVARLLLSDQDASVDLGAQDSKGKTAMHWAAFGGQTELLKLLVQMGASTEIQDNEGCLPLHSAAQHGHQDASAVLFKRSSNVDAKTHDGSDAISLANLGGHTGVEVMLRERRENMALSNANHFLEEYEAEENFKIEQRAIKTAKEKERRARKKAARQQRQLESDKKKAEEEEELMKQEQIEEVRRKEDVKKQRTKARPALMKQLSALQQQQQPEKSEKIEMEVLTEHFSEKTAECSVDEGLLTAELAQQYDLIADSESLPANADSDASTEQSEVVGDEVMNKVVIAAAEEAEQCTEVGFTEQYAGSSEKPNCVELTLMDTALLQCADAVVEAKKSLPAGELESVDAAVTLCLDVIAKEAVEKLNSVRGRSRLALWQDQARSTTPASECTYSQPAPQQQTVQEITPDAQVATVTTCDQVTAVIMQEAVSKEIAPVVVTAVPKSRPRPAKQQSSKIAQRKQAAQQTTQFVPPAPKPRNSTQDAGGCELAAAPSEASEATEANSKWHPYLDQEHTDLSSGRPNDSNSTSRTVHRSQQPNVQPNSSLPRPINKEGGFVPPAPKPATRRKG